MTETAKRPTWIRTTALVAVIALVVGVTGGWLIYAISGPETPASVWLLRADQATLVQGDDGAVLTLTGVGESAVKFDTNADDITDTKSSGDLFDAWDATFGEDGQRAAVAGVAAGEPVQFTVSLSDARWDAATGTVTFVADDVDGADSLDRVNDVVVAIDGS